MPVFGPFGHIQRGVCSSNFRSFDTESWHYQWENVLNILFLKILSRYICLYGYLILSFEKTFVCIAKVAYFKLRTLLHS